MCGRILALMGLIRSRLTDQYWEGMHAADCGGSSLRFQFEMAVFAEVLTA
jgi:hypothetical protein